MKYSRNCPVCGREIEYTSKYTLKIAQNNNSNCRKCAATITGFKNKYSTKGKRTGKENSFFGKKHTEESKKKMSDSHKGKIISQATRDNLAKYRYGNTNPMFGKTVYEVWIKKYGKEEADRRDICRRKKISKSTSGKNNPMYNKPSPRGSGYGWKGKYKGYYFRSLRELSAMIKFDEWKIPWRSAEYISVKYKNYDNKDRTCRPDFILNDKYIIEIKPIKLINTPLIKLKIKAFMNYCINNNLKFKIFDVYINTNTIYKLWKSGTVVFDTRYDKKIRKFYAKMYSS